MNVLYYYIDELTEKRDEESLRELYNWSNDKSDKLYIAASIAAITWKTIEEVEMILDKKDD